jgi:hypothetical protein
MKFKTDAHVHTRQWEANGLQHKKRNGPARDHTMFTSDDLRESALVGLNRRIGGDVGAVAKIFVERSIHKATHFTGIEASAI